MYPIIIESNANLRGKKSDNIILRNVLHSIVAKSYEHFGI